MSWYTMGAGDRYTQGLSAKRVSLRDEQIRKLKRKILELETKGKKEDKIQPYRRLLKEMTHVR